MDQRTGAGHQVYAWDAAGRLVSVTQGGTTTTSFGYDPRGVRVTRTAAGSTTVSLTDGKDVLAEYPAGGSADSPTVEYVYGLSGLAATMRGSTIRYQLMDALSVRRETDSLGATVTRFAHYPFGEKWAAATTGSPDAKRSFTSYEDEDALGLKYAVARFHDPALGRFISPDPVSGFSLDPQSWNRFTYAINDPITNIDPDGNVCVTFRITTTTCSFSQEYGEYCTVDVVSRTLCAGEDDDVTLEAWPITIYRDGGHTPTNPQRCTSLPFVQLASDGAYNATSHPAIDFAKPYGTAIPSQSSGIVLQRVTEKPLTFGYGQGKASYGNAMVIAYPLPSGATVVALYAHMSSTDLLEGRTVANGMAVGNVGNTGHSLGNHLHYETYLFPPGDNRFTSLPITKYNMLRVDPSKVNWCQ